MKLLAISSWFPYPPDNGSKLRAFHLLSHLAQHHDITLLSFAESGEEADQSVLKDLCRDVRTVPGNPCKPAGALRARDLFSATPRSYVQTYSPRMQDLVDAAVPHHDAALAFQFGSALYLTRHSSDSACLRRSRSRRHPGSVPHAPSRAGPMAPRSHLVEVRAFREASRGEL